MHGAIFCKIIVWHDAQYLLFNIPFKLKHSSGEIITYLYIWGNFQTIKGTFPRKSM
jgi:hypothetical protein